MFKDGPYIKPMSDILSPLDWEGEMGNFLYGETGNRGKGRWDAVNGIADYVNDIYNYPVSNEVND